MRKLLVVIPILFFSLIINAQIFTHSLTYSIYARMQSFEAIRVDTLQASLTGSEFDFLRIQQAWWRINRGYSIDAESKIILDVCKPYLNTDKNISQMNQGELFLHAMAHGFVARVMLLKSERISAASNYLDGVDYLEACIKLKNPEPEVELLVGIYNAIIGSLNEKVAYRPILWFFPSGDKQKGLNTLLNMNTSKNALVQAESLYFMYKINTELYEDHATALDYISSLVKLYPTNWMYLIEEIRLESYYNYNAAVKRKKHFLEFLNTSTLPLQEKLYATKKLNLIFKKK